MSPEFHSLWVQFVQEVSTKGASLVVGASKHTGVFVSFYDIGSTVTNVLKGLFK